MTLEYEAWRHGGVQFPLTAETTNPLLQDADPALFHILDYLVFVLEKEIGPRLAAEGEALRVVFDKAVRERITIEPIPRIYAERTSFPVFALYRKTDAFALHTLAWPKTVSEWEFAYILPGLTPREQERLQPILVAVRSSLAHACWRGKHPQYLSGANMCERAGLQSFRLVSAAFEPYAKLGDEERYYRALVGKLEVVEREAMPEGAFETFGGANVTIDLRDGDGTTLANLVEVQTQQPPTIASISPNSGSKAGGTSVTCTGTRFLAPATLVFDNVEVDATVLSATSLSAVTPPHAAYPTFISDVILKNGDGQSVRLPAAFSFTTP